mgnify:CR=1 FL=1
MTTLVIGASGLLGSNVAVAAHDRSQDVLGTYHTTDLGLSIDSKQCDITDRAKVQSLLEASDPDLVVNCAAVTDVDECEQKQKAAQAVNAEAPKTIAEHCAKANIQFVHVSTDYVFDGNQHKPYAVDDDPNPIQQYGQTKNAGEHAVEAMAPSAIIVRPSFIYGIHRGSETLTGFPSWVAGELRSGNSVPLFTDQYVTPSRAGQVAEVILNLARENASGIFHVACRDCITPYEFGQRVARRIDTDGAIVESSQTDVEREAPRPTYTCLDVQRVENQLQQAQPTLQDDLDRLSFSQI